MAIHDCKYCRGKLSDITIRLSDKSIRCRRCGEKLSFSQLKQKTKSKILREQKK